MIINSDIQSLPAEGWELFYKDGSVVSSKNTAWADAPVDNVLVMIVWHEYHMEGVRKKTILSGLDYYLYVNSVVWGSTNDFSEVDGQEYKRGVWTTDEDYQNIYRTAFEKLDF